MDPPVEIFFKLSDLIVCRGGTERPSPHSSSELWRNFLPGRITPMYSCARNSHCALISLRHECKFGSRTGAQSGGRTYVSGWAGDRTRGTGASPSGAPCRLPPRGAQVSPQPPPPQAEQRGPCRSRTGDSGHTCGRDPPRALGSPPRPPPGTGSLPRGSTPGASGTPSRPLLTGR